MSFWPGADHKERKAETSVGTTTLARMSLQMSSLRSAAPAKAARPHRSTLVVKALFQSRKAAVIEKEREVEKKPVEKKKWVLGGRGS